MGTDRNNEDCKWMKNEYLNKGMILILLTFIPASLLLSSFPYFVAKTPLKEIVFLFLVYTVVFWSIVLYVLSKEPRYIAISEDGVHFRYKEGDEKHIKWEEIKEIYFIHESKYGARGIIDKDGKKTNLGFVDYKLAKEIQKLHREHTER